MFKVGQRVHNNKAHYFCTISNMNNIVAWVTLDNILLTAVAIADLHETADDMFEALGFEKENDTHYTFINNYGTEHDLYIIEEGYSYSRTEYNVCLQMVEILPTQITPQFHLAIHQKLIELGLVK